MKLLNDGDCRSGTQGRRLEDIRGSRTRDYDGCYDGGSDVENGVTLIKTRLLRKGQGSGSDTMLEILNDCILYFSRMKEYTRVPLYRRHMSAVQVRV